jgi:long-chain acyl-CoA synthetase
VEIPGFWRFAEERPHAVLLIDATGREHRAGELLATANRVAHGLRARGVASGDAVAFLLPNGAPLLELLAAGLQSGLYLVPLNTHATAPELALILADSGTRAFFADASFGTIAARAARDAGLAPERCFAVGEIPGFTAWESLPDGQPDARPEPRSAGQFLQYTSGTTGRPKGVARDPIPWDPDVAWSAMATHLARFGIAPGGDHVHLTTSPMYHTAPLAYTWFSLCFGHRVVLMDRFDAERALALIERHQVTTTHMVPTQLHRLLQLPDETRRRYDVSSLRAVLHAAAPCPVETKHRVLDWWGPVLWEYYGATEGGGTIVSPREWLERPGTVGRPWEGAAVRVLDDEGKDLPPRVPGTVYLKLLQDFRYRGDAAKTAASRIGDFFTVGDVGWLDEEGYLYLCDRKIDMIISGGVNVYPAEVEAALLAHPSVGDAAVFGVPDEDWGEAVKAVVEPAPGTVAGPALGETLLAHCRERLAGYKCPRSIDFVDELPRDPNGKLYKRRLRDPYWADRERKI